MATGSVEAKALLMPPKALARPAAAIGRLGVRRRGAAKAKAFPKAPRQRLEKGEDLEEIETREVIPGETRESPRISKRA